MTRKLLNTLKWHLECVITMRLDQRQIVDIDRFMINPGKKVVSQMGCSMRRCGMYVKRSIVAEVNGRRTELTVFEWTLAVRNNRQTNDPFTSPSQLITVQIIRHLLLSPADSVCEHGRVERLDFGYCFRVNDRGQCGQTVAVLSANSSTD
ncbi:hypothetical protein T02_5565 [Trichinella nativa]|uniref:Uncharacterized protein n=2 Tax=Trichinella TaxID=6333 RepID=A0A0V1LB83_9BILA|nr:hypothetical protein T06_7208 [Trichinella sp. T6]KRY19836.1 hypothetical protein T12_713 [Trichinella patagoniensis]KRZ56270.1 hypothetical protein T02_5565 [Trichinella nativa]